jgi:hypothetical protein
MGFNSGLKGLKDSAHTERIFTEFDIWIFFFLKSVDRILNFIKEYEEYPLLYVKTNVNFWSFLAEFLVEWEICSKSCREYQNTLIFENSDFYEKTWKNIPIYIPIHIPIYIQQDATLQSLFISGNLSTCFGWYLHQSSGAYTTVSTASDICYTVTATRCYSGR